MTIQWTGFPVSVTATASDILVGLAGGTANARFNANSFLFKANNLSDVANAATSRTNLGLGTGNNVAFLNVFAGASGTAGVLRSYSSSATTGYLGLTGVANGGNYAVVISNASHGQASTYSIPDGGQTASNFLISNSAGTQHIATGGFQVDAGSLLAGLAAGGTAGSLTLYPSTTSNGFFKLLAVNAGAAFNTTISNSVMGQSTVVSIPDPGASTANFVLSASAAGQSVSSSTASATPGTIRSLLGSMTGSNSVMSSGNLVGVRGVVNYVGASGGFLYGVQGKLIPSGTVSGSSWNAGLFGQLDISAATVNAGQMAPIWGDYGATSGTLTNQTGLYGIAMTNTTAAVLQGQVYLYGGAQNLLLLETNAGLSGVTYFKDAGTGAGSWGNATPPTPSKVLKILVDGTAYYLPLVSQNT